MTTTFNQGAAMQFVNGVIYGAGFTGGAVLILVVIRAIFHVGVCG